MKLFGGFGTRGRLSDITYPVLLTSKAFAVTPSYLIHRIYSIVSLTLSVRRNWVSNTCIAQIRGCFVILVPTSIIFPGGFSPTQSLGYHTCLAANLSICTPQPCRKQLASSKMARTSSPFAAPPFFIPAFSASSSIDAAFEAAAERYVTASVGFGLQPQPCLIKMHDQIA